MDRMMGSDMASASGCPFSDAHVEDVAPKRCPVSRSAREFDAFEGPYLLDPAEALRWSREQEPVFFSEQLGYWVVSRYEDVKAIFRDVATFSPRNTLERILPFSDDALKVLKGYDYQMNRTLVNEDEPHHMPRRRALMKSFEPGELAHHQPLVRELTRQYVDRFIDKGDIDIVEEMLWEIPLNVALHFLGVAGEDMGTLRKFTVAYNKIVWGRPSAQEQLEVADSVGQFWVLAGEMLDRIRVNPEGRGWMRLAVRQHLNDPDVVTDSYLHSAMMAIILAAHETTTLAAANMLILLLQDRHAWNDICANPSLIPNAVEECLRFAGSVKAWRREANVNTEIAGVRIPAGAKLLLVSASANHDERHFEGADRFDIYRDNTASHLTFGYGSHQCLGKNLARMELCVFLEELTRRLPHLELAPNQELELQESVSLRGPEHLRVIWDPAKNPERQTPALRSGTITYPIGSPAKAPVVRKLRVAEVNRKADGVVALDLEDPYGRMLSVWAPGAHIDIEAGGFSRKYSLCGSPDDLKRYRIAVLKDPDSRGGSAFIHESLRAGDTVNVRSPKNLFRLHEDAPSYVLIAGGIGITPILTMADRLQSIGKDYVIHYVGRREEDMAFLDSLKRDHGEQLTVHLTSSGQRPEPAALVGSAPASAHVYACGPVGLLEVLRASVPEERLHIEFFANAGLQFDPSNEESFDVELEDSGFTMNVRADQTLLQALQARGIDVPADCEEGLCGSCEVRVVDGDIDHRDKVLTATERNENRRMMACCSRIRGERLVLAL